VLCSSQDYLRTGTRYLDHPILVSIENTNSWHARKRDLHNAFPLDILMVPSSAITITADCECLTCGGFSLGETICLGNFEFITKYFGDLSLSPRRGYAGVAFMGSTRSGASTPRWAMMEDSAEEFLMASSREGSFAPPLPKRAARRLCLLPSQPHHG
jgi:hypothetical protein